MRCGCWRCCGRLRRARGRTWCGSLGLSAPTVTSVVRDLLEADLVEPLGEGVSKGGRPPDMIRFKAERGCLAAVQISATELRLLLTDLNGRELGRSTMALRRRASTPDVVCGMLRDGVRALLEEAGAEPRESAGGGGGGAGDYGCGERRCALGKHAGAVAIGAAAGDAAAAAAVHGDAGE